jgi:putative spermidine/putrescine transport system permease protein
VSALSENVHLVSDAGQARRVFTSIVSVSLFVVAVFFIVAPLAWLLLLSFASGFDYPSVVPRSFTLQWWRTVFDSPGLVHSAVLSVTIAPVVLAISAVLCLPAAYAIGRSNFFGKRAVLLSIFAVNAFPRVSLYVSMIPLLFFLNVIGTFTGVVIVQLMGTILFMTWIPATGFAAIPEQLVEAARDAGATRFQVFRRILIPLAWPSITVAAVLAFLAAFDEAQGTFLVGQPTYVTMPVAMYNLVLNYPVEVSAVFAVLLSIPSVVLLLLVRNVLFGTANSAFHVR